MRNEAAEVDALMQKIERLGSLSVTELTNVNQRPAAQSYARMYANAMPSRLNGGFATTGASADAELLSSRRQLVARSRMLVRDAGYAKNGKRVVVNNVVHTGIKLQAMVYSSRGKLNKVVNDAIECAHAKWAQPDSCHTGGCLSLPDIERMSMGQVFEAGEVLLRIHHRAFGKSKIPIALEVVETERLVDGYSSSNISAPSGAIVKMGVEVDEFDRPIAYYIRRRHPGDVRLNMEHTDYVDRVVAADIIHLVVRDRWPQTRGEPWMHAALNKLQDMNGYSEAEIVAARGAANYIGTIETQETPTSGGIAEKQSDGTYQMSMEPGALFKLNPGEKFEFKSPNRPNTGIDSFMRFMLREVASAIGTSYESLSRDYSQSNYSSSRLALLDDRDLWRALQGWFIQSFRIRFYKEWLQAAVLSRAIPEIDILQYANDVEKYESAMFRPRGWSWIDPTKEVDAYIKAVKAGFTTVSKVIGLTGDGDDFEDTMDVRQHELEEMASRSLVFETSPEVYNKPVPTAAPAPKEAAKKDEKVDEEADDEEGDGEDKPSSRTVTLVRVR